MKLHDATTLAEMIQRELQPFCSRIEIAGSIRRARPDVNDIDLVILPKTPMAVGHIKDRCKQKCRVTTDGRENFICRLRLKGGAELQLDLFFAHNGIEDLLNPQPTNFGSLLLCRTGSKEHNIQIAQRAKSMEMKWKPYEGLFAGGHWLPKDSTVPQPGVQPELEYYGGKLIASETEEDIFEALGTKWIAPALREVGFNPGPSIPEILNADSNGVTQ